MYQTTTSNRPETLLAEVRSAVERKRQERADEARKQDMERQEREQASLVALSVVLRVDVGNPRSRSSYTWDTYVEELPGSMARVHPVLVVDGIRFIATTNGGITALVPCSQPGSVIAFHKGDVSANQDRAWIVGQLGRILDENCTGHCPTTDPNGEIV